MEGCIPNLIPVGLAPYPEGKWDIPEPIMLPGVPARPEGAGLEVRMG